MNVRDEAFLFGCGADELVGVVSRPQGPVAPFGVLVVVGGPQYRVGSHRQFVLLARSLAARGIACMRFDYRGMGDASGEARSFEAVNEDVRAALDLFCRQVPELRGVVLWGLCDGASAACFYAPTDSRVSGLILLNPWVRTAQGEARTYLKHYYLQRLFSRTFWLKLFSGKLKLGESAAGLTGAMGRARTRGRNGAAARLPDLMREALLEARLPVFFVLSGRDYVAREFDDVCRDDPGWAQLLDANTVRKLDEADHTFSSADHRDCVAKMTCDWCLAVATAAGRMRENGSGDHG